MPGLPTGTVTFLFTDIEGSTELLQLLGDDRYAQVLEEHRRLLRARFQASSGHEIETQGDGFLVAFQRARDALTTVLESQLALKVHPWPESTMLRVRVGAAHRRAHHCGGRVYRPGRSSRSAHLYGRTRRTDTHLAGYP
ncbi:MAG: adenylate/guanylate cyclase domain-containing protein [bacterium]